LKDPGTAAGIYRKWYQSGITFKMGYQAQNRGKTALKEAQNALKEG